MCSVCVLCAVCVYVVVCVYVCVVVVVHYCYWCPPVVFISVFLRFMLKLDCCLSSPSKFYQNFHVAFLFLNHREK